MLHLGPQLSVTLAPLVPRLGGAIASAVERLAPLGFRSIQLSAALKGIRPRDLDRRARRDVLALLARHGLMLSGLDLMIRHADFLDPATQDRAVASVLAAIDLARDYGSVPLSLTLPVDKLGDDIRDALLAAADARSVALAVHAEHDLDALRRWLDREDQPALSAAIDPAALLASGHDVDEAAVSLAARLRLARLDDYALASMASAGGRCPVGQGQLDITTYRAALATAPRLASIVVELRDLPDPLAAARHALRAWDSSSSGLG